MFASLLMLASGSVHAVVNAVLKSGGNRLVQLSLSSGTGTLVMVWALPFVPLPHGAWGWMIAANIIHIFYFYTLTRARDNGQVYRVLESYVDQAALDAHGVTDYFRAAGPKLGPCLAAAPSIEYLDAV